MLILMLDLPYFIELDAEWFLSRGSFQYKSTEAFSMVHLEMRCPNCGNTGLLFSYVSRHQPQPVFDWNAYCSRCTQVMDDYGNFDDDDWAFAGPEYEDEY